MQYKKPIKFPTILGVMVLTAGVFGGSILSRLNQNKQGRASGSCQPINIQISNLSYNSAYISYITDLKCQSSININDQLVSDIKGEDKYKVHYFHISNLQEKREYRYKIISEGEITENDKLTFTTLEKPTTMASESDLAWGKILNTDGSVAKNILLYLNIPGLEILSAISNSEGNWHIPFSSSQKVPDINIDEEIIVFDEQAQPTILTWNTNYNDPIPDITLGSDEIKQIPEVISERGVLNSRIIDQVGNSVSESALTVENPNEGETINIDIPQFFGKSKPGVRIQVELNSTQSYTGEVESNTNGEWNWTSPGKLEPGEHTITVSYIDPDTNLVEKITRSFVVYAADDGIGFSATTSATIPTTTPTKTPTQIPEPTSSPQPTSTIVPTPTEITRIAKVDSTAKTPVTGNTSYTIFTLFVALFVFITGRILIGR